MSKQLSVTLMIILAAFFGTACEDSGVDKKTVQAGEDAGETAGSPAGEEPGGEDPAGEEPGGEDPAGEEPGGEEPGGEEPGGEEPGGEEPGGEEPGGEEPGGEEPGGEEPGGEEPGGEEPGGERPLETVCDVYCDTIGVNCVEDNALFEDRDACMAFCVTLPEGTEGDTNGNSAYCRLYHGGDPSALDPNFHCMHAGVNGGGVCVNEPPGPCDRFCANALENCPGDFQVYTDSENCLSACAEFSLEGNFGDDSGNTIQCRDRHAQLAFDDPVLCLAASADGGGVCVDDGAHAQVDRMGRPAINTALITPEHKDLYNAASVEQGPFFAPEMSVYLEVIDGLDGDLSNGLAGVFGTTELPDFDALASFLANDVILINTAISDCTGGYLATEVGILTETDPTVCGGRTLGQDVMDVTLQVLVDVTALFGNEDAVIVTDAIDTNDLDFPNDFPYLAPAH